VPDARWLDHVPLRAMVDAARDDLAARGLVQRGAALGPWRALSLSLFLDRYGLGT
jgi:hypothetical protein